MKVASRIRRYRARFCKRNVSASQIKVTHSTYSCTGVTSVSDVYSGSTVQVALNQIIPAALRLENYLYNFANGAAAAFRARNIMRERAGLFNRVSDRDRKLGAFHQRNIAEIVSDECDLIFIHSSQLQHFLERCYLLLIALAEKLNAQLLRASLDTNRLSPADYSRLQPGAMPEVETQSVFGVETLLLVAIVGKPQAPVSEHTIAIH